MSSCRVICSILVMVTLLAKVSGDPWQSGLGDAEHRKAANFTRREVLEAITNQNRLDNNMDGLSEWDVALYRLWGIYNSSLGLERTASIKTIHEALTHMEYVNSRIDMVALLLFGPEISRSTLSAVRAPGLDLVDDWQCVESTVTLFEKHCGLLSQNILRHIRSFANICNYVADRAAVEEAIIMVCGGITETKQYDIDLRSPCIDRVTSAPIHDSTHYCERISVNGVSRMKLGRFAKIYRVLFDPTQHWDWHDKAQVCVHTEASLGLCQCEKDDWISLENELWSFVMPPYEQRFVDLKFSRWISGRVTVSLDEVLQGWRYVLLAAGTAFLFLAPIVSKYILARDVYGMVAHFIKWVMRIIAVTCILLSSIDTHFAMVAVVICLAVHYVISSIKNVAEVRQARSALSKQLQQIYCFRGSLKRYSLLICLVLSMMILLTKVNGDTWWSRIDEDDEHHKASNVNRWEVLEAVANQTRFDKKTYVRSRCEDPLYRLWRSYSRSSISKRSTIIKIMKEALTRMEYVRSRIDMAGLILFGPEKSRSTLQLSRGPRQKLVNDFQCLESTLNLIAKHCGIRYEHSKTHMTSFANMCNHVTDKALIKEAFIVACGLKQPEPYVVNVKIPKIKVIPAPIHGSSEYCERVSVDGVSRMKLGNFAKMYRVLLIPTPGISDDWHDKAQICVHKNASLGLCQCEKDDWKPLQNRIWSFVMSPYEKKIVDVKFARGIHGSVAVSLDEVSKAWRYGLLAVGFALLFLEAVAKKDDADVRAHYFNWMTRLIAVTCVFQSSIDTPIAMVAVATCLVLHYVIGYIKS